MKYIMLVKVLVLTATFGCNSVSTLSLSKPSKEEIIAIQPLNDFNIQDKKTTLEFIGNFFKRKVVVLPPINIPDNYFHSVIKSYSADSIATFLLSLRKDNFVEVIGLTDKPLYTIRESSFMPYYNDHLIGFGYQPGHTCVITNKSFNKNSEASNLKLQNSILHELGHNMGLSHCQNDKCAMFEKNPANNYGKECRDMLEK